MGDEPVREPFPTEAYRGVHAHKKEKWAQEKTVERLTARNIRRDPAFLPSFRHEI
jgi:hypothetical protein